jgi:hypothetical protein
MANYDVELNLGDAPGALGTSKRPYFGIARSTFQDGMTIRAFGHYREAMVAMPPVAGEFSLFNDGRYNIKVKRGEEEKEVLPGETAFFVMDGGSFNLDRIGNSRHG